jgi:ethanolamine utilization protein EutN
MFMGRVVGTVWSTVKWENLEGVKFLLVRPYHLADLAPELLSRPSAFTMYDGVVAADVLGAGVGEDVVVSFGHSARVAIEPELADGKAPSRPVDAAVVAIVDHYHVDDVAAHAGGEGTSLQQQYQPKQPKA